MTGAEPLVTVQILGLPLELRARAVEHAEELRREFTLIADQLDRGEASVPHRLIELIQVLRNRFSSFTAEQDDELEAAFAAGRPSIDLTFRVPGPATEAAVSIGTLMDEADEYCREGRHLLTLATPPDLVAYRHWFLGQFVEQAAGAPPTPWPEFRQPG